MGLTMVPHHPFSQHPLVRILVLRKILPSIISPASYYLTAMHRHSWYENHTYAAFRPWPVIMLPYCVSSSERGSSSHSELEPPPRYHNFFLSGSIPFSLPLFLHVVALNPCPGCSSNLTITHHFSQHVQWTSLHSPACVMPQYWTMTALPILAGTSRNSSQSEKIASVDQARPDR